MNTWDRLAAEGFGLHECAKIMHCNPRTAAKELLMAHERRVIQRKEDLDKMSHAMENPAYPSLLDYGTKNNILHGKTRQKPVREIRIPQSPI